MSWANINSSLISEQERQGISGIVIRISGNQMPNIGETFDRKEPEPVKTTVWIFSGRIPAQSPRLSVVKAQQLPNLTTKVSSDEEGKFFVNLPPGEYTVLAQYEADLYLNAFLGDGSYATVQVSDGQITPTELINTESSIF